MDTIPILGAGCSNSDNIGKEVSVSTQNCAANPVCVVGDALKVCGKNKLDTNTKVSDETQKLIGVDRVLDKLPNKKLDALKTIDMDPSGSVISAKGLLLAADTGVGTAKDTECSIMTAVEECGAFPGGAGQSDQPSTSLRSADGMGKTVTTAQMNGQLVC